MTYRANAFVISFAKDEKGAHLQRTRRGKDSSFLVPFLEDMAPGSIVSAPFSRTRMRFGNSRLSLLAAVALCFAVGLTIVILLVSQVPSDSPRTTTAPLLVAHSTSLPTLSEPLPVLDATEVLFGKDWRLSESAVSASITHLCGDALLEALGLDLVATRVGWRNLERSDENQLLTYHVTPRHGHKLPPRWYKDMQVVGRASTATVLASAQVTPLEQQHGFEVKFGPFPEAGKYHLDILLTWVGRYYVGQKWKLPDRNDNPPLAEKKRKCLALSLEGNCSRFGKQLLDATEYVEVASSAQGTRPQQLCRGSEVGGRGFWAPYPSLGVTSGSKGSNDDDDESQRRALLQDYVGLNALGGVNGWRWSCSSCKLRVFNAADARRCFRSGQLRNISNIGIFGDSMMVELFNQFVVLLKGHSHQGKHKKLRFMEFTDDPTGVRIRFSRSYTTREGKSVIANPTTIVRQLESTSPEVVVGNLAVLHWQQNMREVSEWESNLEEFARMVAHSKVLRSSRKFYFGPTMIQMGRTQGLEPYRTRRFAAAARRILSTTNKSTGEAFEFVDPMELSVARRESAYDGQHWACYHLYGGVAQMILQLLLNQMCN